MVIALPVIALLLTLTISVFYCVQPFLMAVGSGPLAPGELAEREDELECTIKEEKERLR